MCSRVRAEMTCPLVVKSADLNRNTCQTAWGKWKLVLGKFIWNPLARQVKLKIVIELYILVYPDQVEKKVLMFDIWSLTVLYYFTSITSTTAISFENHYFWQHITTPCEMFFIKHCLNFGQVNFQFRQADFHSLCLTVQVIRQVNVKPWSRLSDWTSITSKACNLFLFYIFFEQGK